MKLPLPPDVEFHEGIGLLANRPRGLLNRAALNKIISVVGELEFTSKKPFTLFPDAVAGDAVDLNLEYVRRVSLYRHRFYGDRPVIKTATPASGATLADDGQLPASPTQGSPIHFAYFRIVEKPRHGLVPRSSWRRRKRAAAETTQLRKQVKK
jgi:hypothetical protein